MYTLFLLYFWGGLFLSLVSLPLLAGKIKPNPFYGFRLRATLEDRDLRYALNRYFASRLLLVGLLEAAAAFGLYRLPNIGVDAYALSVLAVFVLGFSIAMLQCIRYLRSIERAKQNDSTDLADS